MAAKYWMQPSTEGAMNLKKGKPEQKHKSNNKIIRDNQEAGPQHGKTHSKCKPKTTWNQHDTNKNKQLKKTT